MRKRKRVYFDDDEEDQPPCKKLKVVSGEESLNFLRKRNNIVFKPNEWKFEHWDKDRILNEEEEEIIIIKGTGCETDKKKIDFYRYFGSNKETYTNLVLPPPTEVSPKKEEKTKGFSKVNRQKDIIGVFGEDIPKMLCWNIKYPPKYDGRYEKHVSKVDSEFDEMNRSLFLMDERSQESYIESIVRQVCLMVSEEKGIRCKYGHQDKVTGHLHAGPVDFLICFDSVKVVIIEAKKDDISEGARHLIMELKALQEEQEMNNKWYCGFSALGRTWRPLRLNMNKKGRERIEVGEDILIPRERDLLKIQVKKVMYVLYKMTLGEI